MTSKNPLLGTLWPMTKYFTLANFRKLKSRDQRRWMDGRNEYLMRWASTTMRSLGVEVEVIGEVPRDVHGIYVGNHISYLDIPLLCSQIPVIFIAKKELAKWPLIGSCCRLLGTVLVDRSSKESRLQSAQLITRKITQDGENIAVFPSGTTSINEHMEWRRGSFRISKQYSVPIIPFRIDYSPRRAAAYIDNDVFVSHIHRLRQVPKIKATIEFGSPRVVQDIDQEVRQVRDWCREPLLASPGGDLLH